MAMQQSYLKMATFNCRSVKTSVDEVRQLCDSCDIVMIQEHWLLPHDLGMLSMVHPEFLAVAKSSVNVTDNILIGRPYGGTAILYRKDLASNITAVDSFDPMVCAVKLLTNCGPVLFICVYLPADTGDADCVENYTATCAHITALCEDCDATQYVIAGDFNCSSGSRFNTCFQNFVASNNVCMTDNNRLVDVATYYNDAICNAICNDAIMV